MADKTEKDPSKKEVLDLLSDQTKVSRRERQRQQAVQKKTIADKKAEALDIFEEEGKKKTSQIRKVKKKEEVQIPPITKKIAESSEVASQNKEEEPIVLEEVPLPVEDDKVISLKPPIIVADLAEKLGLKPFEIMKDLIALEVFVATNQAIEPEVAAQVCETHGFKFAREKREKGGGVHRVKEVVEEPEPEEEVPEAKLNYRAPIITLMGHVDHGKTSILDHLRKSRIRSGEAGGITQHIGAYGIEHEGKPVTFIDTPGHAVFTEMRARGADITDIVVLVVAADDGVMPQTKEAISHAKAAEKTIIVAINKIDAPGADVDRVKAQLMENGLNPVDYGGDIETVEISALKGTGMDELVELMALQAEVLELKADPSANCRAIVIEAKVRPGKGPTATVVVENGTLKVGMRFICGHSSGKVKSLLNDFGEYVKEVGPATPVEILGFTELPLVGGELVEMESEKAVKKLSDERQADIRKERLHSPQKSRMEDLLSFVEKGAKARLNLIIKTDAQGSAQAIGTAIGDVKSDKVEAKILHKAAGAITESDILLASTSGAVVLGFNTKVEPNAVRAAKAQGVQVKLFSVIYELLDQVKEAMLGMLEPELREEVIGHAEVKQVFKVHKGKAAGCYIRDGKILRKSHARVLRGRTPVFDGKMSTLRRYQDEVQEVKNGLECGIRLGDFNDYEEGDIIECYNLQKIDQTL